MAVLAAIMFVAAGWQLPRIRALRAEYDLTADPVEGVSPELVLATTALGAFRGLISDFVWIRAEMLKEQGRYFEIVQLATWACELNPRFPKAWAFHAWNCAYNVSVELTNKAERWRWVNNGIKLLRDKAIEHNPNDALLYFELCYIYYHKVIGIWDDAHNYYKQEFTTYYNDVLGGPAGKEDLQRLIDAPRTREGLLKNKAVKEFVEECAAQDFDIIDRFFEAARGGDAVPAGVKEMIASTDCQEAYRAVGAFARARRLREECKLEPSYMLMLSEEYGEFDWRLPQPHVVYWAHKGLEAARRRNKLIARQNPQVAELSDKDLPQREIDFDRHIYNALRSLMRYGDVSFDSQGRMLPFYTPNFKFADKMCEVYEKMLEKYGEKTYIGLPTGYANFLEQAVIEFHMGGNSTKSREYYAKLQKEFPEKQEYQFRYEFYVKNGFKKYVSYRFGVLGSSHWAYAALIYAYKALALNDDRSFQFHRKIAQQVCREANEGVEPERRFSFRYIEELVIRQMAIENKFGLPQEFLTNLRNRIGAEQLKAIESRMKRRKDMKQVKPVTPGSGVDEDTEE